MILIVRIVLFFIAFLALRRVLSWVTAMMGLSSGDRRTRAQSRRQPESTEQPRNDLGDQRIEDADYEELP